MAPLLRHAANRRGRSSRTGFTLIELTIVMVVAGLLLVPLLRMAGSAAVSTRLKKTQDILETASATLIAFAAANDGCLPFAADSEGGLPDTDAGGSVSATPDTGIGVNNQHAGDLPWADLGLTNDFFDGDRLRIQYYVATPYTGANCDAGFKGFQWETNVDYDAKKAAMWVYADNTIDGTRTLYEIRKGKKLDKNIHPDNGGGDVNTYPDQLPASLLEVRKGPDVLIPCTVGCDDESLQNVFILIAPGKNRNADIDRLFIRDSTHVTSTGAVWALGINDVDDYLFSLEPNVDTVDTANSGDDTMLVMSFAKFRVEMGKLGLNMEPVCDSPC